MEPFQEENQHEIKIEITAFEQRPFAPFVANTLQVERGKGVFFDGVSYNERYNVIIVYARDRSMRFYNATTLLPLEGFETRQLESAAHRMSYWPQIETYLLGCMNGAIYTYHLQSQALQRVQQQDSGHITAVSPFSSEHYAFTAIRSNHFSIANLQNRVLNLDLENQDSTYCLQLLENPSLFLSSQRDGAVQVYRTTRLPGLKKVDSLHASDLDDLRNSSPSRRVQQMRIQQKDYVLTVGDSKIRIWHFIKGKMRQLKVIHTGIHVVDLIYLEDDKMLVTTHGLPSIKFWRFPSGRLESTLYLDMLECRGIFPMKDKNCLGVSSLDENMIKIVKLYQE